MAEEEVAAAVSPVPSDHKRKLENLEPEAPEPVVSSTTQAESLVDSNSNEIQKSGKEELEIADGVLDFPEAKRPRLVEEADGSAAENGHEVQKSDEPLKEKAQQPTVGNLESENDKLSTAETFETQSNQQPTVGNLETENGQQLTVENLQTENNQQLTAGKPQTENDEQPSGGNLQIAVEDQPATENDQKDVAHLSSNLQTITSQYPSGGDLQQPAVISQHGDLSAQQQAAPETQTISRKMEIPSNKVGVLIGRSGDTIRYLQFNSGAKIQITRDADADQYSSTRPVELVGTLENINKAEKMIKDVITESDAGGSPSVARGFGASQGGGPTEQVQIQVPNEKVGSIIGKGGDTIKNLQTKSGARIQVLIPNLPEGDQSKERTVRITGHKKQIEMAREMIKEVMNQSSRPSHHSGNYNQRTYRPHGPAGPPQWGARAPPPTQPTTGYDYQNRGRGMYPSQNSQYPPQNYSGYPPQQSAPRSNFNAASAWDQRPSAPVPPQMGGSDYYGHAAPNPAAAQVSYNHGHPHGQDYGQPASYSQSAPSQQGYGTGYDNQPPSQHAYGGAYPQQQQQQQSSQPNYSQQPYNRPPSYGMPSQGPTPQSFAQPKATQPGDMPYPNMPPQQSYPYPSTGPTQQQQAYPYGPTSATPDGYNQPPPVAASNPAYPQQGGQVVSGYGQPGGQLAPGYPQGAPVGGYAPYSSSSQPGYNEQPVSNTASYGYQGPTDPSYNNAPTSAYGAAPSSGPQAGYVQQQTSNQSGYEQTMPQSSGGYGGAPVSAPVGYTKSLSPQPGYAAQYDATQMYAGHH